MRTLAVAAPDGRELCVSVVDAPLTHPVLVNCGTPNSRVLYEPWLADARERGLALLSYDRPGYGGSTPHPDHTVADGARDVQAIASALGIERLAVWGFSGGGPYTLACAAMLPDLVCAAGVVGSIAPWGAPGLDYFSGMGEDNRNEIELYFSDPAASRANGPPMREQLLAAGPDELLGAWSSLLAPVDAAALTGGFAQYVVDSIQVGLAPGDQGWWDDGVAHLAPWGFELADIGVPVKVWHGRHDRFVPFQHGQWLASHVPGAQAALRDEDGHLTLLTDGFRDVHAWLAERV